jgi:tetratricopeptide (TPR) repeat protein
MWLYGFWCEVKLAEGTLDQALNYVEKEIQQAIVLGESLSMGLGKATLGNVLTAMKRYDEAFTAFQESLALIGNEDPLQSALTKKDWGKALLEAARADEAVVILEEAQHIFRQIEALDEVEEISMLLNIGET